MKKIKILHITQSLGGVETYIREIITHIDKEQFDLKIISPPSKTLSEVCAQHNVAHIEIDISRNFNPFSDSISLIRLYRLIKRERPSCVHIHSSKAGFLGRISSKLAGYPSLFTPNGVSYLSFTGMKRLIYFTLESFAKFFTDRILTVSYSEANRLIYEVGHKQNSIDVLLNSVTFPLNYSSLQRTNYPKNEHPKIGTIARLTPQKNPLLYVTVAYHVIQTHPESHFYLLGAGFHDHLKTEVIDLINRYGIADQFHILDWCDPKASSEFINSLDVFVLTSVFEGLPYSLLESMRAGVPCVVSACDGCLDVVRNGENGYACLTKEQYVKAILDLLENPILAKRIGENGASYSYTFHNSSKNSKILSEIYKKVSNPEWSDEVQVKNLEFNSFAMVKDHEVTTLG
ncbi:glycosyltransferase [Larkinella terrae]|uniref:Glycosyltransferase n=1 Tax=Larkinella terrae TaxID=2025311 RepID=A0A7K0EHB3_9BACT|nr:glycosyltransferase [Larkinella terrae]MRS60846.1 glycosyltransferase [Larkinella terrae]